MTDITAHGLRNIIMRVIRFDLPLSRARLRSLARLCLLSRTHDHGVRWRWRWRRLMTHAITRAVKRARDRHNCARGVTACVIHHFDLFSPSHTRGGSRSLELAVTRAPS